MEFKQNMDSTRQIIKSKCFGQKRSQSRLQHHSQVLGMINYKLCDIKVYLDYENERICNTFPQIQQYLCNMCKIHWLVVEIDQTLLWTLNIPYFSKSQDKDTHTHTWLPPQVSHTTHFTYRNHKKITTCTQLPLALAFHTHLFPPTYHSCKFHTQHTTPFQITRKQSHTHVPPFLAMSHSSKFHTQCIYVYFLSKSQDNN